MATQWTADAYEGFSLSTAKKTDCKRVAMILVHEALRHYHKFDSSVPRAMDTNHWKLIKSSENVTMYRDRQPSRHLVKDLHTDSAGWQMPRALVGTGTISSSMDDLLFGLVNGDEAALMQSANYAEQPMTNAQVLSIIEKPTLEHPYRSTTLEWNSGNPSSAFRGLVKDRDTVYIRATGILKISKHERIGYSLVHSVDLPSTPPLKGRSTVRTRLSSCVILKPVADGSVEVFIKGYYEAFKNNLLDSIAVVGVANELMDTWLPSQCAKGKKLSWLLQRKNVNKDDVKSLIDNGEAVNESECRCCKKKFRPLRKAYSCTLCDLSVCRKCVLPIDLFDVAPKLKLMAKKVRICLTCNHIVSQISSNQVARQEIRAGRFENNRSASTIIESSRISQLTECSSALVSKRPCAGEVYKFDSDQRSPSTEDLLNAFARLVSSTDDDQIIEFKKKSSDKCSAERDTGNNQEEMGSLIENVWRDSIFELKLNDKERDRQLAWLKMTEQRLRLDD